MEFPEKDPKLLDKGKYKTDLFNRKPIFLIKKKGLDGNFHNCFVKSWEEAYTLLGHITLDDINPAYLISLITKNRSSDISPYKGIQRLKRSSILKIDSTRNFSVEKYNSLKRENEFTTQEAFYEWTRKTISNEIGKSIIKHKLPIGIEHSSGIDSNVILSSIVNDNNVNSKNIYTWSHEGDGEREFINLFREKKGLRGKNCITYKKIIKERQLGDDSSSLTKSKIISIFGALPQIGGDIVCLEALQDKGCKILFSGHGGDQAFSHNGENLLIDLILDNKFLELYDWIKDKKTFIRAASSGFFSIFFRSLIKRKYLEKKTNMLRSEILINNLTEHGKYLLKKHNFNSYPWELDRKVSLRESLINRVSADWVSVRLEDEKRLANSFKIHKAFPFLNEKLISTIISQDPISFSYSKGDGRKVARESFKDVLPLELYNSQKKGRSIDYDWENQSFNWMIKELESILKRNKTWNEEIKKLWDINQIEKKLNLVLDQKSKSIVELYSYYRSFDLLDSINLWFNLMS